MFDVFMVARGLAGRSNDEFCTVIHAVASHDHVALYGEADKLVHEQKDVYIWLLLLCVELKS